MASMIDIVARAIAKSEGWELPNDMSLPYAEGSRIGQCMSKARAAIKAMREPTIEMKQAGFMRNGELGGAKRLPEETYKAMIDRALKG